MAFIATWHTLLDHLDDLPSDATLVTPLSHDRFRIEDVQEHRVVVRFEESGETRPLQREQFETLYRRVTDEPGGFDLARLPADADPYPAVWTVHPRFEVDEEVVELQERETPTGSTLVEATSDGESTSEGSERSEPDDVAVYPDLLLLVDALERHDASDLRGMETEALVNLYTLCSDVQRGTDDLRKRVTDALLDRVHHDQPVHGEYGSVQRTARTNRTLKDDEEVLAALEAEGIDPERVTSVDASKVDDALDVTTLSESDVYEVDRSEYVRKADVDDDEKATRLQGLKDRLAGTESDEAADLRAEVEELEKRIDDLTSFRAGSEMD